MTAALRPFLTGPRLRLASGLVLMTFAATHLLNHALGLVGPDTLASGRAIFLGFWRQPAAETLLLLALLTHATLGLVKLWRLRSLRLPPWQWLQIGLGLLIPFYLTLHILGTGWLHRCCGVDDSYFYLADLLWPGGMGRHTLMLTLVWLHGCLGLHFWMRLRPLWRRLQPLLLCVAVLLPVLAWLGFVETGRTWQERTAADPELRAATATAQNWPDAALREAMIHVPERRVVGSFAALVVLVLLARLGRQLLARRSLIRIRYDGGLAVRVPRGMSLLEASRTFGVPHAAVCGGRGRCSTCRVRVLEGAEALPHPEPAEARVLERIAAGPGVRLACQLRPPRDVTVARLVPPQAGAGASLRPMDPAQGRERELAVLFTDLRGFTRLAEHRLPYDTVHLLNRYFAAMGGAVEEAGGHVDKFVGDGVMALFGLESGPAEAARAALEAARRMAGALERLNSELAAELAEPLRLVIGIHLGPVIVGEMGWGRATALTAIGDTVNVAARLEALCKELGAQLVVSEELLERAAQDLPEGSRREVAIRGRTTPLPIRALADARTLPAGPAPSRRRG
ncbi:adenylate/guanylate cyclase domain-containing protein [Geminicoccaceae bacterium 1502E]|nr:adenylate/guanylate cyclase domain-containing protein [Geminicoccaceae bacterium 1502E]